MGPEGMRQGKEIKMGTSIKASRGMRTGKERLARQKCKSKGERRRVTNGTETIREKLGD